MKGTKAMQAEIILLKKRLGQLYKLMIDKGILDGKPVVCNKCHYSWETASKEPKIKCLNCKSPVFLNEEEMKEERERIIDENSRKCPGYVRGKDPLTVMTEVFGA